MPESDCVVVSEDGVKQFLTLFYSCARRHKILSPNKFCDDYTPDVWSRGHYMGSNRLCSKCIWRIPQNEITRKKDESFKKRMKRLERKQAKYYKELSVWQKKSG